MKQLNIYNKIIKRKKLNRLKKRVYKEFLISKKNCEYARSWELASRYLKLSKL